MCQSSQADAAAAAKTPRSPWRRLFRQQPVRPRLSRRVASGARINLNRYWSKFEEVTTLHRPQAHVLLCTAPANEPRRLSQLTNSANDDNAINDNLINERTEFGNLHTHTLSNTIQPFDCSNLHI